MTASRVFLDTAPFIYLVEEHPVFCPKVARFIAEMLADDAVLLTSVVTYSEFCVQPARRNNIALIEEFDVLLADFGMVPEIVSLAIGVTAYKLRAKYAFLRGMDAMQLATALELNATIFFTNDRKLQTVQELRVLLVTDL